MAAVSKNAVKKGVLAENSVRQGCGWELLGKMMIK